MQNSSSQIPQSEIDTPIAGLVLVSTPIGNLRDITLRAISVLRAADLILCEDTRTTARLLTTHAIHTPTTALHDHNEDARIPALLDQLQSGRCIALVSDAGTPLMADPGFRLVRAAIAAGIPVSALPGPNAAIMALTLSGLPPHPFVFLGFPPPKQGARRTAFSTLHAAERAGLTATLIWYEAPHRLAETLADLHHIFGDRQAAIGREFTKRFEEMRRGALTELLAGQQATPAKGEIVIVLSPYAEDCTLDERALDARIDDALQHHSPKDAAALLAAATGLSRKLIYTRVLQRFSTNSSALHE